MTTSVCGRLSICKHRGKSQRRFHLLDKTLTLDVNGTKQRVRLCGAREGLPPVLIVQAGPGFPLLNEVAKFQQRLDLEQDFTVAYWEQRGCGPAALHDVHDLSLETQIDDLGAVVRWLAQETQQQVVVLGISLGATLALQAASRDAGSIKAIVAVSLDSDTSSSDSAVHAFLQQIGAHSNQPRVRRLIKKLGAPPYTEPAPFQLRARLLTELGGIEHGKRFGELLRSMLYSLIRSYGWVGTVMALRNMNAIQRKLLPELAKLNLFAQWPQPGTPVHYVFGGRDPLTPPSLVQRVSDLIAVNDSVVTLADAGHMAHFDQPDTVRSIIVQAHAAPRT